MFLVNSIITSIVMVTCYLYISSRFLKRKISFRRKSVIFSYLILIIVLPTISYFFSNFMKIILAYTSMAIASKYIFKEDTYKTILIAAIIFAYYFVAELVFSIIIMGIFGADTMEVMTVWKDSILANGSISVIVILISFIKPIERAATKFIGNSNKVKYVEIILIVIFAIGIFGSNNVRLLGFNIDYITNCLLIVIFFTIMFYLIKEKEKSNYLSERYEQLFKYMEKYEKELTKKSMSIHEFKNQLAVIKGLSRSDDRQIHDYIDSIVMDLNEAEAKVLRNMEYVPNGGLKGLIYYKLGYLDEENIIVILNINPNTKKSPFSKIKPILYKDILTIIGVYLDNAIEAAMVADKKELFLDIYYEKGVFNFILTNTYKGKIDAEFLDTKNYTTKGKGRGHGLLLANNILAKNSNINSKRDISDNYYVQKLFVNFKNIPK